VISEAIKFQVNQPVVTKISADKNTICGEDSIMLIVVGGDSFVWTTADAKINGNEKSSFFVKPSETTKYYVQAFDAEKICSARDTIEIFVDEYIEIHNTIQLTNRTNPEFCGNADNTFVFEVVHTNGGNNPTYFWHVNDVLQPEFTTAVFTKKLNHGDKVYAELYASSDIITCADRLVASQTVAITALPVPVVETFGETTLCPGESAQLRVSGGDAYLWELSAETTAEITVTPTETTTYTVKVSNTHECSVVEEVHVVVRSQPEALTVSVVPEKDSLCAGQSMTLTLNANYSGVAKWFVNNQEQTVANNTALTYIPSEGDRIHVDMKVDVVCLNDNQKQSAVFTPKIFTVYVSLPKRYDTICLYDTLEISATSNGTAFMWTPTVMMNTYTASTVVTRTQASRMYRVEARIGNCMAADSVYIHVKPIPAEPQANDYHVLCKDPTANLAVLNVQSGVNYLWYSTKNLSTPIATASVLNVGVGEYRVWALSPNGCRVPSANLIEVVQGTVPQASVRVVTPEAERLVNETIEFENTSKDWNNAVWNFGDVMEENNSRRVDYIYTVIGEQKLALTVENESGCLDTVSLSFRVFPLFKGIYVPSAFMPGSTNPEDQVLKVYGEDIISVVFTVYSLTGQELFKTTGLNQGRSHGWDGRHQGQDMPAGNYTYSVVAKLEIGQEVRKSGSVALIR
jgi:hypothetical protein